MKNLSKYTDKLLIVAALVFLGILIAYYSWGIEEMVTHINKAMAIPKTSDQAKGFNFQEVQKINFKGLLQ
jgi:hypothetical protein